MTETDTTPCSPPPCSGPTRAPFTTVRARPAYPARGGAPTRASTTPRPTVLSRAEEFVRQTARVLEQRRFAYHFPDPARSPDGPGGGPGLADAVETALFAYRHADGGFGHGLEPGLRGSAGTPRHVVYALRVLDATGRCDGPRMERLGDHLASAAAPDGGLPAFPAGRHPFGPVRGELLVTAPVVGLLHRNAVWHAWLFRATDFCWAAVESLHAPGPHEIEAAIAFLDGAPDRPRAEAAAERLGRLVREGRLAVLDPRRLGAYPVARGCVPGEHHFPHHYARHPGSLAREWFTDAEMDRSLDRLAAEQQEDGGWPVLPNDPGTAGGRGRGWSPGAVLELVERRPIVTIEALRTLRAYGRAIG